MNHNNNQRKPSIHILVIKIEQFMYIDLFLVLVDVVNV